MNAESAYECATCGDIFEDFEEAANCCGDGYNASFNPRNSQWEPVTALFDAQSWTRESFRKLNDLSKLSENWDGYGSRPIQPAAIRQAASLVKQLSQFSISAPQIFPVPGGGIQFEWKNTKCGMELEILPDGTMEFLIEDVDGQMREGVISPTYENLSRLILWFNCQRASVYDVIVCSACGTEHATEHEAEQCCQEEQNDH